MGVLLVLLGLLLGACTNSNPATDLQATVDAAVAATDLQATVDAAVAAIDLQATVDAAVAATISAKQPTGEPSLTDIAPAPTPAFLRIGTAMDGGGGDGTTPGFRFTVTGCTIKPERVNGPYSGGDFYTFTALPGMRFVILTFSFVNDWVRQQNTPYLASGEVETNIGRFYRVWSPPAGVHSVEYQPRPALEREMVEIPGDSGAFETLLPGKATTGSVSFEIPEEETPVTARVARVPIPIDLTGCGT